MVFCLENCSDQCEKKLFMKNVCKFDAEGLRFEIVTGGFNQIYYIGAIRILVGKIGE